MNREEAIKEIQTEICIYQQGCDKCQKEECAFYWAIEALKVEKADVYDLVRRQDAIDIIDAASDDVDECRTMEWYAPIRERLLALPPARRKTGKWKKYFVGDGWNDNYNYVCSNCDHIVEKPKEEPNFCPRCGADMRGESNEID